MFDWVKFKVACPNCKAEVKSFQSKDGVNLCKTVQFWEVENFYDSCDNCGTWLEYTLNKREKRYIEDYKLEYGDPNPAMVTPGKEQ